MIVRTFCGMVCLCTISDNYLKRFFRGFSYSCVFPSVNRESSNVGRFG